MRPATGALLLLVGGLAGCSGGLDGDTGDATDSATCSATAPQLDRLDVPTGYRVVDATVDAPWLPDPRTVPVNLWYPTDATTGDPAVYIDLWTDPQSLVDAPFADPSPGCKLPLVVYSHGSQAWGGNESPILRHLVAQGWVAAAPDHLDNTLADNVDPHPISYSMTRVADIRATIDALEALPDDDPLAGRIDTSRVLVLGHSYGGQTAWLLAGPTFDVATINARCDADATGCTDAERAAFEGSPGDPRIVGVLPLDGFADESLVAPAGWAAAQPPILYLSKSQDGDDGPITTAAAADVTWARFEGACHETFTGSPVTCAEFDKEEGLDLVADFVTAFAAERVLGLTGAPYDGVLDGNTVLDERITVRRTRE